MNISIGILAYNESGFITKMLNSVFEQTLFTQPNLNHHIELIVIPNGCTDDTANVARTILKERVNPDLHPHLTWKIIELEQGGKSNAWNEFVHHYSSPDSDYLFLMDSDIIVLNPNTLASMIDLLETHPETWVAMDQPIKDVTLKQNKNILEWLSSKVSNLSGYTSGEGKPSWLCGQLYCARSSILRRIWLPTTLPTQDASLYNFIVTNCFKEPRKAERVLQAFSASHIFEAYTTIPRLIRHERWLIIGKTVSEILFEFCVAIASTEEDIGTLIKQKNLENPEWLNDMIQAKLSEKKWWVIPNSVLTRRFQSLMDKSFFKALLFLPLSAVAFIIDLIVAVQANIALHQGTALKHWTKGKAQN